MVQAQGPGPICSMQEPIVFQPGCCVLSFNGGPGNRGKTLRGGESTLRGGESMENV